MSNLMTDALLKRIESLEARVEALEPSPAPPEPTTYRDPSGMERDAKGGSVIVNDTEEAEEARMRRVREANTEIIAASERGLPKGWYRDAHNFIRDEKGVIRQPHEVENYSPTSGVPSVETVKNFRYEENF